MQSNLQCIGFSMVLLSLAPSALTFSRGASHVACREMIPGHIRAQPQDLQRSHVTLRTSTSSYLPGQLVTVTVRSSRDFMGFLLQARSVEGAGSRAGVGAGAGVRSTRVGPVLVGGSWTLTPPGTHTLRCLSEGDTLTHSDKQLKRNLSFVWRAPDVPMGDIRFYITVVQSYFVYWAGIKSAMVHDGSHSPWSGSNITGVDGGNSVSAQKEDEVLALQALRANRPSNKQINETASPATTQGTPPPTSNGTSAPTSRGTTAPAGSGTSTPIPTSSGTSTLTSSGIPPPTSSRTLTPTTRSSGTSTSTSNGTPTPTSSGTLTPRSSGTPTPTPRSSGTSTLTSSGTSTLTSSGIPPPTSSRTPTPTSSGTLTPTPRSSGTSTPTSSGIPTPTRSGTPTPTSTSSGTSTSTSSGTPTPTNSGTSTFTSIGIPTPTSSETPTPTPRGSGTPTPTSSGTPTPVPRGSGTPTPTSSGSPTPIPRGSGTPTPTLRGSGTPTTTSSGTQSYKSQETLTEVTRPVLEMNGSATLPSLVIDGLTNQVLNKSNSLMTLGSLQNASKNSENDTYATSGSSGSGVTEDTGSPQTKDPKSSLLSSKQLSFTTSFSSTEARGMSATTTPLPNITMQNSTSPFPLSSLQPLKDGDIKRKEANFQDPKLSNIPDTKDTALNPETTTTPIPSIHHSFHNTNPPRPTPQNPREPIQDQTSSVKLVTQSSLSQPWRTSPTEFQMKDDMGSQSQPQNPLRPFLHSQTSSLKHFLQVQTTPAKHFLQSQTGTSQTFPLSQTSSSKSFSKSQTPSLNLILSSKTSPLQSFLKSHITSSLQTLPNKPISSLPKPPFENSPSGPITTPRQTSPSQPQLQTTASLSSPPQLQPLSSYTQALLQTTPTQTQGQGSFSKSDRPPEALSISPQPWSQPHSQQTQSSITPQSINPLPFTSRFTLSEVEEVKDLPSQAKLKSVSSVFGSIPSTTPSASLPVSTHLSTPHSSTFSSTHTLLAQVSIQTSFTHGSLSPSSSSMENQPKTAPALSALPSPSPISIPPHSPSVHPSSTSTMPSSLASSTIPSSNSSSYPSAAPLLSSVPSSTSSSPVTSSQSITGSILSLSSSSIALSTSSISSSSLSISTSVSTSSSFSLGSSSSSNSSTTSSSLVSSQSTSPHPGPSPAPRRSLYNPLTSTSSPLPSQQPTLGQRLPIQNHIALSDPDPNLNLPTPRTVVHPDPESNPNLDPSLKLNFGPKLKPNLPKSDTKPKLPSNPPGTPDKDGKYPDIIPRHSAWELGMLLGCSAGLGMVLVVGVRYMYRQACGKRTEVTLNDREREYGRGERGLLHVQECGDLVRVRRIRENSFVLLAEYDILASPGD